MSEHEEIEPSKSSGRALLLLLTLSAVLYLYVGMEVAQAQTIPWDTDVTSWTPPRACSGGDTDLTHCIVVSYEVLTATTPDATSWTSLAKYGPTVRSHTTSPVTPGQHCYQIIAYSSAGPGLGGVSCAMTTKPQVTPSAPLVTVDRIAYKLDIGYQDQFKIAQIGFIALGLPCKDQEAMGLNPVLIGRRPSQLVKNAAGVPLTSLPKQVLAACKRQG